MASKHIKSFSFTFFWMLLNHIVRVSFIFKFNDFFSAFIKIGVEENQVFDCWNAVHFIQIEVNFVTSILKICVAEVWNICHYKTNLLIIIY